MIERLSIDFDLMGYTCCYTYNLTSRGLLQKQSSFYKINRSLHKLLPGHQQYSVEWRSIIIHEISQISRQRNIITNWNFEHKIFS